MALVTSAGKSSNNNLAVALPTSKQRSLVQKVARTSGLTAPIMLLTGHVGEVLTCRFDPTGQYIASGSFDKDIFLWRTYGDCVNYGVLRGHGNAVLELDWSEDGRKLYSASADLTVQAWDTETGQRIKRFRYGHGEIVNSVNANPATDGIVCSGGDDGYVQVWDLRQKEPTISFSHPYPITAVAFSKDGQKLFLGGLDEIIHCWDLRKKHDNNQLGSLYELRGHGEMITGIRVSPDGNLIASNATDHTVRVWDIRSFVPGENRLVKILEGAPHGVEKHLIRPSWSSDGQRVLCGSADRTVVCWSLHSSRILYKLPGHKGCVTQVDWHPKEPIILSGSTDRSMLLGEVDGSKL